MFEHHEVVDEEDYLRLEQVPERLPPFGLLLGRGHAPVTVLRRERHAVDKVRALGGGSRRRRGRRGDGDGTTVGGGGCPGVRGALSWWDRRWWWL